MPADTHHSRAVFGTIAMTAGNVVKLVLQFAVIPVLARILDPSSFGLLALAMPFVMVATMMCDLGLGNALVRVREPSRALESTIFWMALLISSGLALVVCALSWPASRILSEPRLPPILMTMSLLLLFGGGLSVVNARISRERRFGIFAVGDVIASILSSAAAIVAALSGLGAWSLVVQQFTIWGFKAVFLVPRSGFRPAFIFNPRLAWPHLRFGLNAAASSVADLAGKSVPPLIVGGLLGVTALGYYSMGNQIVRLPDWVISGPIYLSIFAAVAHCGDNRRLARPLVLRSLRGLVAVLAPAFCGLAFVAHILMPILLGPKWLATGTIVAYLAPAGFFICIYSYINAVLLGLGQSHHQFRLTLANGIAMSLATLIGAQFGSSGVAAALSIGAALVAPAYIAVLSRELYVSLLVVILDIAPPIFATAVMGVVLATVNRWMLPANPWLHLAILIGLGMTSFTVVLAAISWRSLTEDLRWILAARRGAPAQTQSA